MSLLKIPDGLKAYPNWVGWKWEQKTNSRGEKKWTKPPYDLKSNGELIHAETDNPATWAPFQVAEAECSNIEPKFDGVGFVLPPGLGGVDFDGVIVAEKAEPFVLEILKHLGNPYTEITPSDNGLRAIFNAPILPAANGRKFHGKKEGIDKYGAEIYFGSEPGRYLTITGKKFSGNGISTPPDLDLVHFLMSQIANEKFKKLWMGEWQEAKDSKGKPFATQSEADMSLCDALARGGFNSFEKLDAAFRQSGLMRPEWEHKSKYTIAKALSGIQSDPNKTSSPTPTITATISGTYDQIAPKKVIWLWLRRFAQKLNLIVGNPGVGKGLITYYIMACVTTGRDWFDSPNTMPPSEVLHLSDEEDDDDTIVPRMIAAGVDRSKARWLKMSATKEDGTKIEKAIQLDHDAAVLENFLDEHPNIRLVIIDPISNYLGSTKVIDEQSVRAVLMPLKEMANRRGVAIIAVMHLNKKVELDAIHRISGAVAFVGVSRMVWLVAPKPNEDGTDSDVTLMVKVKGNIVQRNLKGLSFTTPTREVPIENDTPEWTPYVKWLGEVDQRANDLMGKPAKSAHRPAEQFPACIDWLHKYLKDGAQTLDDIKSDGKALYGFSPKTIQRARDSAEAGVVTFSSGKTKARDGKMREQYSCRLRTEATEPTEPEGATQCDFGVN